MSIYEAHLNQIMQPAESIIGQRVGVSELPWRNYDVVTTELTEFDNLVEYYNDLLVSSINREASVATPFLLASKVILPEAPLIANMLRDESSTVNLRNWIMALQTMNLAMLRSESDLPEPSLGFAAKWEQASPRERLRGGILHGYGLVVGHSIKSELPGGHLDPDFHQDKSDFLDALIETAAIAHVNGLPNNPLHELSMTMRWYGAHDSYGNHLFSPFIRKLVKVEV